VSDIDKEKLAKQTQLDYNNIIALPPLQGLYAA
jgi:hypothetical protein